MDGKVGAADLLELNRDLQVAVEVDTTPPASASASKPKSRALQEELDQLDAGQRPQPDITDCYDEARAIALQIERLITDIGQ